MDPELIGRFSATGSNGRGYVVQVWMTFFLGRRSAHDDIAPRIPNAFAEMDTSDGEAVDQQTDGSFTIRGSNVILTPNDASPSQIAAAFQVRYRKLLGYRTPQ